MLLNLKMKKFKEEENKILSSKNIFQKKNIKNVNIFKKKDIFYQIKKKI